MKSSKSSCGLRDGGACGNSNLRIERRPDFKNRIKNTDCTIPKVGNCEGHRIVDAAARIAKCRIRHAARLTGYATSLGLMGVARILDKAAIEILKEGADTSPAVQFEAGSGTRIEVDDKPLPIEGNPTLLDHRHETAASQEEDTRIGESARDNKRLENRCPYSVPNVV
jgi:hypothetical protein